MSLNQVKILPYIPDKPGVYEFLDKQGNILYVGKAKDLKKRVSSYFSKNQTGKTQVMLKKAEDIRHIIVDNESDALLLENNLIKKHQPRYNILLKDDKTYPWICVRKEPYPRVLITRNTIRDGSLYFGPYTSGLMVKMLLEMIRHLYKLRTCNLNLSEDNIKSGRYKPCLEYHIGNCKAPCVGLQDINDYDEAIKHIKNILKGNISTVLNHLKGVMNRFANDLRYEEAQEIKEKIEILSRFQSKSAVVSVTIKNVDVFAMEQEAECTYINYLKVVKGSIIQAFTLDMKSRVDEEKESLLGFAITEIRNRLSSDSQEVIVPFKPDIQIEKLKYTVPEKGEKMRLLELAQRNAVYYRLEQKKKKEDKLPEDRTARYLEKIKKDLHMGVLPVHIECFDNSNIMGKNPVASCVVFRNTRPSKNEYRHFNIRSVSGPDDFRSMEEIVFRRYRRMMQENQDLPQLIIIDGGKGQLSSALKSLKELNLENKITVIGIAKKLEEIYFPGDSVPVYIDKNSITLRIIQQVRNEAHRFGINFHREKRSSEMIKTELDGIKGIGTKTKEILLKEIGSVEKIKEISYGALQNLVGNKKASLINEYLKNRP